MTDKQIAEVLAQYQRQIEQNAQELAELRQVVQKFLRREASFADLRRAVEVKQ